MISSVKKAIVTTKSFVCSSAKEVKNVMKNPRVAMMLMLLTLTSVNMMAQSSGVDLSAGTNALNSVTSEFVKYIPVVTNVCYALAGIVVIVGAVTTFIAMNNGEQDIKKRIMLIIGSCAFLVAAAVFLPKFFGL